MFLSFLPNFTQAFFTVLLTEIHLLVPVESLINRRVEGVYYPFDAHFLINTRAGELTMQVLTSAQSFRVQPDNKQYGGLQASWRQKDVFRSNTER